MITERMIISSPRFALRVEVDILDGALGIDELKACESSTSHGSISSRRADVALSFETTLLEVQCRNVRPYPIRE